MEAAKWGFAGCSQGPLQMSKIKSFQTIVNGWGVVGTPVNI